MKRTPKRKFHVYLIIDISSSYGRNLLAGVSQYVQKYQNWEIETMLSFIGRDSYKETSIRKGNFDGIIVFTPENRLLLKVIRSGVPAIVKSIKQPISGYINFCTDNFMLCKTAYEHFRQLGLSRFAYCGLDSLYWSGERRDSLRQIIDSNNYKLNIYPTPRTKKLRLWENEKYILIKWLTSLPKPIGLLAANDFRAKQVLDACLEADIEVPGEIAVLGVDNDECICPFTNPPLSSIYRFFSKAGYEAALALNDLMTGKKCPTSEIIIETREVIQRQSTNILAVENAGVAEALIFIRSNKNKPLNVEEVAAQVAIHPRVLYNLFKKHLGYTIYDEIKRVRTEDIACLLLETDLTISQIAWQMGFKNIDHVARYFRKIKKMNPSAYRNLYKFQKAQHVK